MKKLLLLLIPILFFGVSFGYYFQSNTAAITSVVSTYQAWFTMSLKNDILITWLDLGTPTCNQWTIWRISHPGNPSTTYQTFVASGDTVSWAITSLNVYLTGWFWYYIVVGSWTSNTSCNMYYWNIWNTQTLNKYYVEPLFSWLKNNWIDYLHFFYGGNVSSFYSTSVIWIRAMYYVAYPTLVNIHYNWTTTGYAWTDIYLGWIYETTMSWESLSFFAKIYRVFKRFIP